MFLSPFLVLTEGKGDKRKSSPRRRRFLCPLSVGEGMAWRVRASFICWEDENWRCFFCVSSSFSCLDTRKGDKRKSSPRRGHFLCPLSVGEGLSWRGWASLNRWEDENWRCLGADIFT